MAARYSTVGDTPLFLKYGRNLCKYHKSTGIGGN